MSNLAQNNKKLLEKYSSGPQAALANVVSALVFSEMRLDPGNPGWRGGDAVVYSTEFSTVIRDAYLLAGSPPESVPAPNTGQVSTVLDSLQPSQRLVCIVSGRDSGSLASIGGTVSPKVVVISPSVPSDPLLWDVSTLSQPTADAVVAELRNGQKDSTKGRWIVAPISEEKKSAGTPTAPASGAKLPALADRMSRLGTESAFDVLLQVNKLRSEGRDIISFGIGEPDFDSPSHVKDAVKEAVDNNVTHYGPSAGNPELRTSIARYIERTRHIPVDVEEVVVTPGAKPVIFDAMMALVNSGDEVLYPNPGYPIYESLIDWIGAKAVPLPMLEENNWNFNVADLERLITPKTKMIVINTPGNPTGTMIDPESLSHIARLAQEHNLWVIADEIYSQIVFDTEFHSIASLPGMKERTIIVDGFSKTYAMTGWRLGYGVMNRDLAKQVAKIETNIDSCTCSFTQAAAIHALDGSQAESLEMIRQFHERSVVITELLNGIRGFKSLPAQGAFYSFVNVTEACKNLGYETANQLQQALLLEAGVAVLPRTCFGKRNAGENQEYIRLSFATSMENIRAGLKRMKDFIEKK